MAVGSIRVVITLLALAVGGTVFEVGIIIAANSIVTIVMSIAWGRLSDYFGVRIRFLLLFFLASAPMFVLLGLASEVWQVILLYTLSAAFIAGIQPIATMYAVEYRGGKGWQQEIVKYNSYYNVGVIAGLVVNSLIALVLPLSWVLYIATAFCIISALILWRTAEEPKIPLERHAYPVMNLQDEETSTGMSVFDYIDPRKLGLFKHVRRLKPIHILFIACLVHWTGVYCYGVGEVPFMREIGLSASVILSIHVAENIAAVIFFSSLVPRVKMEYRKLVISMVAVRSAIILGWAGLAVFLVYRSDFAFIFPLVFLVVFLASYALVWYPIMCYAISQAQFDKKGTVQGELLAVVALANVLGSLLGGFIIATFGYAVGFLVAALISVLAIPIVRFINIEIKTD